MVFLIVVQLFMVLLFYVLGWSLRSKDAYWLISGFSVRPKEEQQQLIENRYPQRVGALLMGTAVGMLVLLPLHFTKFIYTIEIQFGFMMLFLLGGLIYISKYEVAKKRKRSYIISTFLFVVVNGFVVGLSILGYQNYDLIIKKESFEITGMYGNEWKTEEIVQVELMKEMPEVTWKQNGFGLATMAKGYFKVEGYGSSLLFIKKSKESSPYLYIKLKDKQIFINGTNAKQTQKWYTELKEKQSPNAIS